MRQVYGELKDIIPDDISSALGKKVAKTHWVDQI